MSRSDEPASNLYIVNDSIQLGSPFGIYTASSRETLFRQFKPEMGILAEFPGQGGLLSALKNKLKYSAIHPHVPWFETSLSDILSEVGDLMDDGLQKELVSHYEAMTE